jgi:hypothetical protein
MALLSAFSRRHTLLCAAVTSATLAACGGGGDSNSPQGTLRLALTDAPACGYDEVNVTVQKVRVHRSSTAADADSGWEEVVLSQARRLDLLKLQNGVLAELGQTPLPAGTYTQMRLVLADNGPGNPLANSVVPTGGRETALTTPSGQQTGLKTNINLTVEPDRLADFVIDFQVCSSVVRAGQSGRYLLKPVLSVMPRYVSGVGGTVEAAIANGNTTVSLQQGGEAVRSTTPDANGRFVLQPVAPGNYTMVVTAPGRTTTVVTGVAVVADTLTNVGTTAGLTLPTSPAGDVAGQVTTASQPVDASVAAMQALTGGVNIEVVRAPVDGDNGAYRYVLPTAAPQVAPYVAASTPLVFTSDTGAATKYSLVARSGTAVKAPVAVTVAPATTVTTSFTFP